MLRIISAAVGTLVCLAGSALAQPQQPASTTNASVTIATGNTFQTALAAATRRSLTIQNNNATDSCWVFLGATANATKATSIMLLAGQAYTRYYPFIPNDNVAATCASNGDTLYVDWQ